MKRATFLLFILLVSSSSFATEGKLNAPGGRIWYNIQGESGATPLVVIHGGPGGSSCALKPLNALASNRQVIFYDQLGAGKSDQPTDVSLWQINRFVDELKVLLQSLHLTKVHLLAHSWGAAIAGQYLIDNGTEGIASVIYVGPYLSSKDWIEGTNILRKQLPPKIQSVLAKHEKAGTTSSDEYQQASEEFYKKFLFHHPFKDNGDCADSAWNQSIYEHMWGDSEFMVTGNLKDFDAATHLEKIQIPTLFLVGEFDEARAETVKKYQQHMTNAQVTVLKNAAHMSMIDEPKAFIATVNDFLNRVDNRK